MSLNGLRKLAAKKSTTGTATLKGKTVAKPKAAVAEEVEELDEDEVETPVVAKKPTKTLGKGKTVAKPKAAVVEEPEEELEEEELAEEELDDEDDQDDSEVEDEEEELDDEDDQEEEEVEEPVVTKKPTKPAAKPASKTTAKAKPAAAKKPVKQVEEEEADDEEVSQPSGGLFGSTKKAPAAQRELVEGDVISREELNRRLSQRLGCSIADAARGLAAIEEFMKEEVFPNYSVNLFGVRFKRKVVGPRVFSGTGGLKLTAASSLATEVSEHIAVTGTVLYGRESRKGKVNADGEFIEGTINAKGKFVPA